MPEARRMTVVVPFPVPGKVPTNDNSPLRQAQARQ
jgi:hypothetical protein